MALPENASIYDVTGKPVLNTRPALLYGQTANGAPDHSKFDPEGLGIPFWNIARLGADMTGTTDSTTLLETALAQVPIGGTLYIPPGVLKVRKSTTGGATYCLLVTRQINLWCDGIIRADLTAGDTGIDIFKIAVSDAGGYADVRNMQWRLRSFFNGGGRSSIRVEPVLPVIRFKLQDGAIQGINGPAAHFGGNISGTICERVDVDNGLEFGNFGGNYHADQINVKNCTIFGNRTAITIDAVFGAYTHIIEHNFLVARDGAVNIVNGSQVKIRDNQIEQNGVNAAVYPASVIIQGTRFESSSCDITGNNFGGGTNVQYNIITVNANKTQIDYNDFNKANICDVVLAAVGSKNTNIGIRNRYRGSGRGLGVSALIASDQGVGTTGILKFLSTMGMSNSWTAPDAYVRVVDGVLYFGGSITGGTLTPQTVIATLPTGYRPGGDETFAVATSLGAGTVILKTNGELRVGTLPSNAVSLAGAFCIVIGEV